MPRRHPAETDGARRGGDCPCDSPASRSSMTGMTPGSHFAAALGIRLRPFPCLPRAASLRPRNTPPLPCNMPYQGVRGNPCDAAGSLSLRCPQGGLPTSPWLPVRGRRDVGVACTLRRILNPHWRRPCSLGCPTAVRSRAETPTHATMGTTAGDARIGLPPSTGRKRAGAVNDLAATVCPAKCEAFDPQNAKPSPSVRLILRPYLSTNAGGIYRLCAGGGCRCGRRGFE